MPRRLPDQCTNTLINVNYYIDLVSITSYRIQWGYNCIGSRDVIYLKRKTGHQILLNDVKGVY